MMTIGLMLKAYDAMSGVVNSAANKSIASINKVQASMKKLSDQANHFGRQATANGMIAGAAVMKPIQAFTELEDATTDLKIAMLDNLGQVPKQFEAINQQAIQLGNLLPGTTADFIGVARALQEQGTGMDTILNGGLKAASYLGVLLKIPGHEAGEMVAKLRESYGLADNELEKMADLVQKARFAFGMTPDDIKVASSYAGATQNVLGIKGVENAKKLLALQGMGAGVSLEGSSWGTNFAMMMTRLSKGPLMLAEAKKGMKAEAQDMMDSLKLSFDFYDAAGHFKGLDAMVKELEKLQIIKAKFGEKGALDVAEAMFGTEAGRPAMIIAEKGMAGYMEAMQKMERQASLQQRIELSLKTMKNTWDALTGTATNALAMIGEPLAQILYPFIVQLNEIISGPIMAWIGQHQQLVGVLGASLVVFALLSAGLGMLGFAVGAMSSGLSALLGIWRGGVVVWRLAAAGIGFVRGQLLALMGVQRAQMALQALQNAVAARGGVWGMMQAGLLATRTRMAEGVGAMRSWIVAAALWSRANLLTGAGLRGLAASFGGALVNGIKAAVVAVRALSLALLANPLTWIAAAIAAAAFLIYRYWKPISGFFRGLWQGLVMGVAPLMGAFERIGAIAGRIFGPFIGPLKALWNGFKSLTGQVEDTGGAAQKLGVQFGQGIGRAIVWVARLGQKVLELPGRFFDAGVEMMAGLLRGIQSRAGAVIASIGEMAGRISGAFKGALGIHSPSRVFMGYGSNIVQGAALGIQGGLPHIQRATHSLATATVGGVSTYGPVALPRRAGGATGAMTVTFAPTIHVQGGGGNVGSEVKAAVQDAYREFEVFMRRYEQERGRRAF